MNPKQDRPIVIKRGGPVRGKPHGGSWKLAYADFMTAMMAFFLLMWLLGASGSSKMEGIADYFKQPLKISLLGGSKSSEASSILQGGGTDLTRHDGERRRVDGTVGDHPAANVGVAASMGAGASAAVASSAAASNRTGDASADQGNTEDAALQGLKARIDATLSRDETLRTYRNQIMLDVTRDGLRIQIVDTQNRPMFASASADVEPYMRDILRALGTVLNNMPNRIVLEGHTDAKPYAGGAKGYSNWELSTDRANASRRELIAGGMDGDKVLRVIGLSDKSPLNPTDIFDPRNRRISIMVLNRRAQLQLKQDRADAATFPGNLPQAKGDAP